VPFETHLARAFGRCWRSDVPLHQFDATTADAVTGLPTVDVTRGLLLAPRHAVRTINGGFLYHDGFRLSFRHEATFNMVDGTRVEYVPGPQWPGEMPLAFFSTTVALTLAWQGLIPFHATAIDVGGRAFLIAGPPGAGKSTYAAGLLRLGARLVSDDLTVLTPPDAAGAPRVYRGRPAMRLHSALAATIVASRRDDVPGDSRGKLLVRPEARTQADSIPLGGFVLLGQPRVIASEQARLVLLRALFRPRWLGALPGHAQRVRAVMSLAGEIPVLGFERIEHYDEVTQDARAGALMTLLAASSPPR